MNPARQGNGEASGWYYVRNGGEEGRTPMAEIHRYDEGARLGGVMRNAVVAWAAITAAVGLTWAVGQTDRPANQPPKGFVALFNG